ncbi:MAG TPA: hypothetical protein VKB41_08510 [Steroidobacteraceae bacterium]|nr:hypothetical protein [Steroidobacteraceae bacterium]
MKDTAYRFVRRDGADTIILAYGTTLERWRDARRRNIAADSLRIRYAGRVYRFAGAYDDLDLRAMRAVVDAEVFDPVEHRAEVKRIVRKMNKTAGGK